MCDISNYKIAARLERAPFVSGLQHLVLQTHGFIELFTRGVPLSNIAVFGRWASDAFHGYLWEAHEQTKGLAAKMADDFSELTKPKSQGAKAAQ